MTSILLEPNVRPVRDRLRLSIDWPANDAELELLAGSLVDHLPERDVAYLAWRLAELAYFHRLEREGR